MSDFDACMLRADAFRPERCLLLAQSESAADVLRCIAYNGARKLDAQARCAFRRGFANDAEKGAVYDRYSRSRRIDEVLSRSADLSDNRFLWTISE